MRLPAVNPSRPDSGQNPDFTDHLLHHSFNEEVVAADNPPGDLRECCVAHGIFNIFSERFFVHPDACGNQDFLSGGNFVRINAEPSEKPEVLDIDAAAGELQFFKRHDALSLSV